MRSLLRDSFWFLILSSLLLLSAICSSVASGQSPCPRCGRYHGASSSAIVSASAPSGTLDVVDLLNRQRAMRGLPPMQRDPVLSAVASRRVILTARKRGGRFAGHPAGSFYPGRMEGVGFSSRQNPTAVHACGTYSSYRFVGAQMLRTSSGCFFAVVYR